MPARNLLFSKKYIITCLQFFYTGFNFVHIITYMQTANMKRSIHA